MSRHKRPALSSSFQFQSNPDRSFVPHQVQDPATSRRHLNVPNLRSESTIVRIEQQGDSSQRFSTDEGVRFPFTLLLRMSLFDRSFQFIFM